MSRTLTWRATYKEARGDVDAFMPVLRFDVGLSLAEGGGGSSLHVDDGDRFQGARVTSVHASLFLAGDENFGEHTFIAFGQPQTGNLGDPLFRPTREPHTISLWFPVSREVLRQIEDRRAGGKPKFQICLDFRGYVHGIQEVVRVPENPPKLGASNALGWDALRKGATVRDPRETAFSVSGLWLMNDRGNHKAATIEISRWLEILGELKYASFRIYELPVSANESVLQADEHIERAFQHHQRGDWRNCLGEARAAIESLLKVLRATINPVHTDARAGAEKKVEQVTQTSATLFDAMIENQGAWLSLGAAGSHPAKPGTQVERADAELLLNMALAFRQYVSHRAPKPAP